MIYLGLFNLALLADLDINLLQPLPQVIALLQRGIIRKEMMHGFLTLLVGSF